MIAIRLPSLKASSRSWLTKMMVRFISCSRSRSSSCSLVRISGSSAEKGSSISRIGASVAKARARPTRCCMPPDSSPTLRSAQSARPTSFSFFSTRSARSSAGTPASSRPSPTFSRTLRHGRSPNCWNTIETDRCRIRRRVWGSAAVTLTIVSPSRTSTWPRTTGFSPFTARSSVDLPDPESPIRTRISPSATVSEQLWTPRTCLVWAWIWVRLRPWSISGSAACGLPPKTIETFLKSTAALMPGPPAAFGRA